MCYGEGDSSICDKVAQRYGIAAAADSKKHLPPLREQVLFGYVSIEAFLQWFTVFSVS